ncbi:hypothetical protein RDI58_027381 [Solanum bulbocastanum]|uniref:NB-ARC domain-containing protein n=1 Tax=Solanum bulbocastanum TaxID=147425 RepID=A0AAN8Y1R7_SOLBU
MGGVGKKTTLAKAVYNDEKEILKGKKFLVVLDDVWNDDYNEWDDLRNLFVQGDMKSKIIVTIRKENVESMMGSRAINVGTLSSEVSWDLFKRHSLENRDLEEHPNFEEVGRKIADKCKGLPFSSKDTCWVPESEWKPEGFLMHDLVNDLARIASSKLCIRLEENKGSHMLEQSWHMSYSMGEGGDFEQLKPLYKLHQLTTLLLIDTDYSPPLTKRVLHNILPRLTSLRALSLSNNWIVELPDVLFIKLKLLRFLDLSRVLIEKLPDSICVLYNLETLLLSHCSSLKELPLQMEKLINLRHLDVSNTFSLKMLLHLSKLKSLQLLLGAKLLLGGHGGLRMEDLGELHNLYGSLSILELQNVVDRREALKGNFWGKNHVDKLSLEWSESTADNSQTERDILDELSLGQLPSLKFLFIRRMHRITEVTEEFYGSSSSEKHFNSLEKLEFEDMLEWKQWHVLGSGEFPILENLSIENCPKLIGKLPENLYSLTELRIPRCPELKLEAPLFVEAELFTSQLKGMKHIVELSIVGCNSLTSLPFSILTSTLKTITISHCRKLKLDLPVGEMSYSNMFLETMALYECVSIDDISP